MKTIYIGDVRKAYVTKEETLESDRKFVINEETSEKNVMFYKNIFGVVVRLDTGHVYFSRSGAIGYLYDSIKKQGEDCTVLKSCEYINQASFVPKNITKQDFKALKKVKR